MIYPLPPKVSKLLPNLLREGLIQLDLEQETPIFRASTLMLERMALLQKNIGSLISTEKEELCCYEEINNYLSFLEEHLHKSPISEIEQKNLLEQYKIYIEMADRVTERRTKVNSFYLSILTGLFVFSSLPYFKDSIVTAPTKQITLITGLTGIFICILWWINISSYKNLNSLKFQVIIDMENSLPYPCYRKEWDEKSPRVKKYRRLRKAESLVPIVIAIPYSIASLISVYDLLPVFLNRFR
jgi:hypothetical protein